MIKSYELFEAKAKTDWGELLNSLIIKLKSVAVKQSEMDDQTINDLILPLQDIYGHGHVICYCHLEFIKNIKNTSANKYIDLGTSKKVEPTVFSTSYAEFTSTDIYLRKLKFEDVKCFYNLYFSVNKLLGEEVDYIDGEKNQKNISEWDMLKETLESYGFETRNDKMMDSKGDYILCNLGNYYSLLQAKFEIKDISELFQIEESKFTKLIPSNIIDDFEKFLLRKNMLS